MSNTTFPVIILAGGIATRMRPLTEKVPKILLDINGEPFAAHQLRLLKRQEVSEVIICLSYLSEQVVDYLGTGDNFGLKIKYSLDGPILLGTGGALKKVLSIVSGPFFVLYGDSYLECDFLAAQDAFVRNKKLGLMAIYRNEGNWDCSNVEYAGGELIAYDKKNRTPKMKYIDYGLGILSPESFSWIPPETPCDLEAVYRRLLIQKQLAAYEVHQRFYEIGSKAGLEELRQHLSDKGS